MFGAPVAQLRRQRRIGGKAQIFARRPQEAAAGVAFDPPLAVVKVGNGDAAIGVAQRQRKADGIVLRQRPPARGTSDSNVTQHPADPLARQFFEIKCAGRRRAFGKIHPRLFIESDLGDFGRPGRRRDNDSTRGSDWKAPSAASPTDQICCPAATA